MKNNMRSLITIILVVIVIVSFAALYRHTENYWQEKFTIRAQYDFFQPLSDKQKFDIYRDRCEKFRIAYSPTYKFRGKNRSLSNEEFERLCRLTWRIETTLHFPLSTLQNIGILETNLRGKHTGLYNEKGLMQIMASNVDYIQWLWSRYKNVLPAWMNPCIQNSNDFFDIEKCVKSAALILYAGQQTYQGNWKWIITDYHYGGGYTQRSWCNIKGEGELPLTITLNDITYVVTDYWMMWKTLQESFMNNQVMAGDNKIKKLIRTKKKRLTEAQIKLKQYFKLYKTLNKFERQIDNSEQRLKDALIEIRKLKKRNNKALGIVRKHRKTKNKSVKKILKQINRVLN